MVVIRIRRSFNNHNNDKLTVEGWPNRTYRFMHRLTAVEDSHYGVNLALHLKTISSCFS